MRQLPVLLAASALLDVPDSRKPFFKSYISHNSAGAYFNLAKMVACAV
jgi:hypothetical protein